MNDSVSARELASKAGVDVRVAQSFLEELQAGQPLHVLERTEPRRRLVAVAQAAGLMPLAVASTPAVKA